MKKIFKYLSLVLLLSAVGFSVAQNRRAEIETKAATIETKRVWLFPDYVTWWATDPTNAKLGIHYWGGTGVTGTDWPGVEMSKDDANNLWYYDVPANTLNVKFTRIKISAPTEEPYNKSVDISLESYANIFRFELWNDEVYGEYKGAWMPLTPATTTIVANFAATIDTKEEACSSSSAQDAVNAYNALSTFEQDQFDALDVGGGKTGLDRLNYLKAKYGIETPLNARVTPDVESSASGALLIGTIGLTSILGYYFITKKRIPQ